MSWWFLPVPFNQANFPTQMFQRTLSDNGLLLLQNTGEGIIEYKRNGTFNLNILYVSTHRLNMCV